MLYRRKDVGLWTGLTVGQLREALTRSEIPDDWEICPNGVGNLALLEPGKTTDGKHWTRWYIGYIDMATGEVFVNPGVRPPDIRPGDPEQVPWTDAGPVYVDRSDFETNDPYTNTDCQA